MIMTLDTYLNINTPVNTKGGLKMHAKSMKNINKPEFDFSNNRNWFDFNIELNGQWIGGACGADTTLKGLKETGECYSTEELDDAGFKATEFLEESYKLVRDFLNLKNKTQYEDGEDIHTAEIELYNFLDDKCYTFKWTLHLTYCP